MRVDYDPKADAVYIRLSRARPDGAVEIAPGVHADTTAEGRLVGIEILGASGHMDLGEVFKYEVKVAGARRKRS